MSTRQKILTQQFIVIFLICLFALLLNSCGAGNSGNTSLTVTATDVSGSKVQGVNIVLGDSNGRMKSYGTTDANGQITFTNPPANATVSAATSCVNSGSSITSNSIHVEYDVNTPIVMHVNNCSGSVSYPPGITPVGQATVNMTSSLSNVRQYQITGFRSFMDSDIQTSQKTIDVLSSDLRYGKLWLLVIGKDANGRPVGYGFASQDFEDDMQINIVIDKPMSFVEFQVTNIPAKAVKLYSRGSLSTDGMGSVGFSDVFTISPALSSTTIRLPYIPGSGGRIVFFLTASLDQDGNGTAASRQILQMLDTYAGTPAPQTFDFATALSAPSNLAVSNGNTATPTLSWSGLDARTTSVNVGFLGYASLISSSVLSLSVGPLAPTRTSITFPELPDSLAAFRAGGLDSYSLYAYSRAGVVTTSSAGDYPNSPALGMP